MRRIFGIARFIRLDHLDRKLAAYDWDTLGLTRLQDLRDEVKAERQKYLDDPDYAKAEEAANGR